MKKKIALAGIAVFAALGSVAGLSAFEAYVINVTAQIENALFVHPEARDWHDVSAGIQRAWFLCYLF